MRSIAGWLGVETVLEGSVRKAGNQLRITAQLIDAEEGYHLWSESFDRELSDVFAIQDEIAQRIVQALRVELTERERRALTRRPAHDVEAYELYLRGRQFLYRTRRQDLEYAIEMFERAIQKDPDYARAQAGIADCHSYLYSYFGGREEDLENARAASARALELAPDLAEAHASHGLALSLSEQFTEAEREFESALLIDPELYEAHYFYARTCMVQKNWQRAARFFEKASEVKPEDIQSLMLLGLSYRTLGLAERAEAAYRAALERGHRHVELNPDDARALYLVAQCHVELGEGEKGLEWGRRARALAPDDPYVLYGIACLFAGLARDRRGARAASSTRSGRAFATAAGSRWIPTSTRSGTTPATARRSPPSTTSHPPPERSLSHPPRGSRRPRPRRARAPPPGRSGRCSRGPATRESGSSVVERLHRLGRHHVVGPGDHQAPHRDLGEDVARVEGRGLLVRRTRRGARRARPRRRSSPGGPRPPPRSAKSIGKYSSSHILRWRAVFSSTDSSGFAISCHERAVDLRQLRDGSPGSPFASSWVKAGMPWRKIAEDRVSGRSWASQMRFTAPFDQPMAFDRLQAQVLAQRLEVGADRGQAQVGVLAHRLRAPHAPRVEVDQGEPLLEGPVHRPQPLERQAPRVGDGHQDRPLRRAPRSGSGSRSGAR